ncbi:unnamed protein product [Linum tenue]|uniref:AP2/ERF domain-containing protein n=1 Tax=Linum tenue TaxID=586396 RepID=A0AAV0J337_9ROSI|nr:unnamed protein product [Linum tenue]
MAPAPAAASNWLSFSLSPMEMLRSSSSSSTADSQYLTYEAAAAVASSNPSPHYFLDSYYSHGWGNTKEAQTATTMAETALLTSFMEQQSGGGQHHHHHHQPPPPKLEDFLGGDSSGSMVRYSEHSQTETQDSSSLTHIYDNGGGGGAASYFNEHQDLKAIAAGYQGAFSSNSGGSEVDDQIGGGGGGGGAEFMAAGGGHSIESAAAANELGFSTRSSNGLSLGVTNNSSNNHNHNIPINSSPPPADKSVAVLAVVESDCSKKLADTFGQRTSIYRGVTRHRWTGRYEAHLWDNSCRREGQARKGRQGGYDKEDKAARAYDLAALKYWGPTATTNFPVSNYNKELEEMKYVSKQEFIASLRRKSSGFSRGASIYRGVTRHHQQGRWQARIGRVAGNKDLYLGTFATEEEAAEAYDIAAIKFRGLNAVTNFEMNRYDVEAIMKSALPIGGAAKRLKISLDAEQKPTLMSHDQQLQQQQQQQQCNSNSISFGSVQQPLSTIPCGIPFDATTAYYHHHHNLFQHMSGVGSNPGGGDSSGSASNMENSMSSMLPQTTDFFLWPHQPY